MLSQVFVYNIRQKYRDFYPIIASIFVVAPSPPLIVLTEGVP